METYIKDKNGQWWCQTKRQRCRAKEQTCEQCGKLFQNRHSQQFCSRSCRSTSQKGVARTDRTATCAHCGKLFQRGIAHAARFQTKYCSPACGRIAGNSKRGSKGEKNGRWKGGIRSHAAGYVRQWVEGRGHLLQHRVIMEQTLGRPLERFEEVHHKNSIRNDNRPANLELWAKRQPGGARVKDLIVYAKWVLATYGPLEGQIT